MKASLHAPLAGKVNRILRTLTVCFLPLIFSSFLPVRASAQEASFEAANKLYEQGRYVEALSVYQEISNKPGASAALHFNMGNAYFKAGQIGNAIFHYRLAETLAPGDSDVQANLKFARESINAVAPANASWQRWLFALSLNQLSIALMVSVWLLFALLIVRQLRPQIRVTGLVLLSAAGAVLLAAWIGLAWRQLHILEAVVLSKEAVARYGPLDESRSSFVLREGAELKVTDQKGEWFQVQDTNGRSGWVRREQVGAINRLGPHYRSADRASSRFVPSAPLLG